MIPFRRVVEVLNSRGGIDEREFIDLSLLTNNLLLRNHGLFCGSAGLFEASLHIHSHNYVRSLW
jgi:hypothetical protein